MPAELASTRKQQGGVNRVARRKGQPAAHGAIRLVLRLRLLCRSLACFLSSKPISPSCTRRPVGPLPTRATDLDVARGQHLVAHCTWRRREGREKGAVGRAAHRGNKKMHDGHSSTGDGH